MSSHRPNRDPLSLRGPRQLQSVADRPARRAGGHCGIGLKRDRNLALARFGRLLALGVLLGAARSQFLVADHRVDRTAGDVDLDHVAVADKMTRQAFNSATIQ